MIIQSMYLDELDVPDDYIIHFPNGLSGFEEEKEFVIIEHEADSPFIFFQSVRSPELLFITIDPFAYFSNYQVELDESAEAALELSEENLPMVFCIVHLDKDPQQMTANLLAPLIVNQNRRLAGQIVLHNSNYETKQSVFGHSAAADSAGLAGV